MGKPPETITRETRKKRVPWLHAWLLIAIGVSFPVLASWVAATVLSTKPKFRLDDFFLFCYLLTVSTLLDYYKYRKAVAGIVQWKSFWGLVFSSAFMGINHCVCKGVYYFKQDISEEFSIPVTLVMLAFFLGYTIISEIMLYGGLKEPPKDLNPLYEWWYGVIATVCPTLGFIIVGLSLSLPTRNFFPLEIFLPRDDEIMMLACLVLFLTLSDWFAYRNQRSFEHLLEYYVLLLTFALSMMLYGILKAQPAMELTGITWLSLILVIALMGFLECRLHPDNQKGG